MRAGRRRCRFRVRGFRWRRLGGGGAVRPGAHARGDQARLQLAQERRVGLELLGQPGADPVAARGRAAGEPVEALGAPLDEDIGAALAAGVVAAKVLDWRGHAHPRD